MNGGSTEIFFFNYNIGEDAEDSKHKKFKGDNEASFNKWILQFEGQSDAVGVENKIKRQVLLCLLEDSAFTLALQRINNEMTLCTII